MEKNTDRDVLAKSMLLGMNIVLFFCVLYLLSVNFFKSSTTFDQPLAEVNGYKIFRIALAPQTEERLRGLEIEKYKLIRQNLDEIIEKEILNQEARKTNLTPEALLRANINKDREFTKEEVYQTYVQSPKAHAMPYDQALKDIAEDLKNFDSLQKKSEYLSKLYPKYKIVNYIKAPQGAKDNSLEERRRFNLFKLRPAAEEIAKGKVVAPPFLGPKNASILLEVFSDFMCPFSAEFSKTVKNLHELYPDSLRIEFRHQPLSMHKEAQLMAEASVCAQEQGRFWEYQDLLFKDQKPKSGEDLIVLAKTIGLNERKFKACLLSGKYRSYVRRDIDLANDLGARGTPSYLINGNLLIGVKPLGNIKKIIDWFVSPKGPYPSLHENAAPKPNARKTYYEFKEVDFEKSPFLGSRNAPITLVEFIDYNCPFCKKGSENLAPLLKKYKDKIRLISKQNPLSFHPNAHKGSQAALCAFAQGKYWEYRESIFGKNWGKQAPDDLKVVAKELGINQAKFNQCLDSDAYKDVIESDLSVAKRCDVSGTPSYFINGAPLVGSKPTEEFEKVILQALAPKE